MDLETENRIATLLLKEAAELRRQAEKEGALAYLKKPNVRGRPNSRFLTATVLGVQQANRAVEVNEMWRVRQKEIELNHRVKGRPREETDSGRSHRDTGNSLGSTSKRTAITDKDYIASCSSSKRKLDSNFSMDDEEGLRDEELEKFLHSRVKRGRGDVGPRMDETGPYPPLRDSTSPNVREHRVTFGPEKPSSQKYSSSSEEDKPENVKKHRSRSSKKHHSTKCHSKEKLQDKKRRRKEEKRSRNHK